MVESLDYVQPTSVEIKVIGIQNFNADSRFGFGFMWIPQDEENYKNLETPHYQNTFISNGPYNSSFGLSNSPDTTEYFGAGINGASMNVRNVHFRQQGASLIFTAQFEPNTNFTSIFESLGENDRKYILWQCALRLSGV